MILFHVAKRHFELECLVGPTYRFHQKIDKHVPPIFLGTQGADNNFFEIFPTFFCLFYNFILFFQLYNYLLVSFFTFPDFFIFGCVLLCFLQLCWCLLTCPLYIYTHS